MQMTHKVANFVSSVKFRDLSPEVIEATKLGILDTLACMLPATRYGLSQGSIHSLFAPSNGIGESTLVGTGGQAPALEAAFLNGTLAHALDFDDTSDFAPHHPTANTLPTAMALGERNSISGKDLLLAVAVGNDISVRMATAPLGRTNTDYPFLSISMMGIWGSVTAASKALSLSEAEIKNAYGLALYQAAGVAAVVFDTESDVRSIRDGFTNRSGALAALLASAGVPAMKEATLETFYEVFYRNEYSPEKVLAGLDELSYVTRISLKPWSSDRETHGYIEAALSLRGGDLRPEDIEGITLTVGPFGRDRLCEPLAEKRRPSHPIAGRFSLPFVVALALSRGHVGPADFSEEALGDPEVLRLADKVRYVYDDRYGQPPGTGSPARVTVTTSLGAEHAKEVSDLFGSPVRPMARSDIAAKFHECAELALLPMTKERADEIASAVWGLDSLADVKELTVLFR